MNENHPDLWKFNFSISREQLKSPSKLPLGVRDNVHRQLTKYSLSRCSIYASSRTSPHFSVAAFTCCSHAAAFTPSHLRCRSAARAPQHLRCSSRAGALQVDEDQSERISPLPRRQNPEKVDSAAFHQLITPQQWTEGRPPQQWQIQNYVCHVLEKTNLPIWNRLDNGLAGSWQQELGFK